MIDKTLKHQFESAISDGKSLGALVDMLHEFKSNGGTQQIALDTLDSLRANAPSEAYEDLVLEVMDFASGFCSPQFKVWD